MVEQNGELDPSCDLTGSRIDGHDKSDLPDLSEDLASGQEMCRTDRWYNVGGEVVTAILESFWNNNVRARTLLWDHHHPLHGSR